MLARETALSDIDAYYARRGRQFGEFISNAYVAMRPDDEEMPLDVVVNVLVAFTHSKRERGLW